MHIGEEFRAELERTESLLEKLGRHLNHLIAIGPYNEDDALELRLMADESARMRRQLDALGKRQP